MGAKLTPKQEAFVHKYMETGSASEAYRHAYATARMKPETIHRTAHDLLTNPKVAAMIAEARDELAVTSNITKEQVLYHLEAIMKADIQDYVEFKGNVLKFKPFDQLTKQQRLAIESIKQGKYGIELKLHGKSWTIQRIAAMLGMDEPRKVDHTSAGEKLSDKRVIILPDNGR